MKRLVAAALFLAALIIPGAVAAADPPPAWDLTGTYTIVFVCSKNCGETYTHSMTITTVNATSGDVSGTGYAIVGGSDPADYAFSVTGAVHGSSVDLRIDWQTPPILVKTNPLLLSGAISSSGAMSGTAFDGIGREFTWNTPPGAAHPFNVAPPAPPAPLTGRFTITETVKGDVAGWAGGTFVFQVTCGAQTLMPVAIAIPAGGGSASDGLGGIVVGLPCTVTRSSAVEAGLNASWGTSTTTPSTFTIGTGNIAIEAVDTRIVAAPSPKPSVTPRPSPGGGVAGATGAPKPTPPSTTTQGPSETTPASTLFVLVLLAAGSFGILALRPERIRR